MNELETVRELFPEFPPPDARVVARARGLATGQRRRGLSRTRWIMPGLGMAAVTTTAVGLAVLVFPADHGRPAPSSQPMSARQVLLMAAASSANEAPRSGKYWFIHAQVGQSTIVAGRKGSYIVEERRESKDWTDAHSPLRRLANRKAGRGGSTTHYWAERSLGVRPARPADVEAWKRAGSPSRYPVPLPGGKVARLDAAPTPWRAFQEQTAFQSAFADGSLRQVRDLPTDPDVLRQYFLSHPQKSQGARQEGESDAEWLLESAAYLLSSEPAPAPVREAAYRMLAALPGVRAVSRVTDPLGRPGTMVAVRGAHGMDRRIIIDPSTGRLLAQEDVSVGGGSWPAGSIVNWWAPVNVGWTDQAPKHAETPPG